MNQVSKFAGTLHFCWEFSGISKFALFNSVLPFLDIGTDINSFLVYLALNDSDLNHYHPKWAILTISWVFAPFVIHVGKFFYELAKTKKAGWFKLFIHVPFVQPLRNLYLARKLHKLGFGFDHFDPKNWVKVKSNLNLIKFKAMLL